jgi:hypothetical protein
MTSVLNVDTIAAKNGTSPVGLTKQKAMVVCVGFNMHSDTKFVANNTAFSENLNTSSFTDSGTGNLKTSLTNTLANTQFIITTAAVTANNNVSVYTDSTTRLKCLEHCHVYFLSNALSNLSSNLCNASITLSMLSRKSALVAYSSLVLLSNTCRRFTSANI